MITNLLLFFHHHKEKRAEGYQYRNLFQTGALIGQWSPKQPFIIHGHFY